MAFNLSTRVQTRLIRILLLALVCFIAAFVWINVRRNSGNDAPQPISSYTPSPEPSPAAAANTTVAAVPTPIASPAADATLFASPLPAPALSGNETSLLIPVAGVRPDQLQDTYTDSRSEGRVHDAIDIPAARNTPVLACADGTIVKFFQSARGGTTIYQLDRDNKTVYYYAHLDHYADGLAENHFARRGEVIGYVGDTGNAGAGNYHLHFSISIVPDPKHYYGGTNINPYPLLHDGNTH
jgi:murein DD-endopeptidase MepM/ murein hydrolase activator NlpD